MAPLYTLLIEVELETDEGLFSSRLFDPDTFDVAENALDLNTMASHGLSLKYGIEGYTPIDRVASTGQLSFTLRNDAQAFEGQACFSPGHVNVCQGWTFGIKIHVIFSYLGVLYKKFVGKIDTIDPDAGSHGAQKVYVVAYDYIKDLTETEVRELTVQLDKTEAELLEQILDIIPTESQPILRDIDAGIDVFPIAFDDFGDGTVPALTIIHDLTVSSLGYSFIKGDGTFRYITRHANTVATSQFSFDDNNIHGLEVPTSLENVFNQVKVVIHPRSVSPEPIDELYSLPPGNSIKIDTLETHEVNVQYKDPENPEVAVGGIEIITDLIPGVHYKANTVKDGHSFGTNQGTGTTVAGVHAIGQTVIAVTSLAPVTIAITSNSIGTPTVITSATHGLTTGRNVTISGVTGSSPPIDGSRIVTVLSPTTFSVPINTTVGGTGGKFIKYSGSFLSGDVITIAGNNYNVKSSTGGQTPSTITIAEPGLIAATAGAELVTLFNAGSDITSSITAVLTPFGSNADWELTNNGGVTAYITLLKVIGKVIRTPEPIKFTANEDLETPRRIRPIEIDLPYQDDANFAQDAANVICRIYEERDRHVSSISFLAVTHELMMQAMLREPGDKITITEYMTGLVNVVTLIQSVSLEILPNNVLVCTWGLSPTSSSVVWLWGVPGFSEWGQTTYYGF